jgi:hypothetical protein
MPIWPVTRQELNRLNFPGPMTKAGMRFNWDLHALNLKLAPQRIAAHIIAPNPRTYRDDEQKGRTFERCGLNHLKSPVTLI